MKRLTILTILLSMFSVVAFCAVKDKCGATVKINEDKKMIHLIFSADSTFEGAPIILDALKKRGIKGSFFLTGNFFRLTEHKPMLDRIIKEGHYVGGHSNGHLLYADWDRNRTNLVSDDSLKKDLKLNYVELSKVGIKASKAPYILPPYEWYNAQNIKAIEEFGIIPINFTPGIETSSDYTTPDMRGYKGSKELIEQLYNFEKQNTLNGTIILIHPGTEPSRTDKLYNHLGEIIDYLTSLGYNFERF